MDTTKILNDLQDARAELKELERYEKQARKAFAAGISCLAITATGLGFTGNGAFMIVLLTSIPWFLLSFHWFFLVYADVRLDRWKANTPQTVTRIWLARQRIRELEHSYTEAMQADDD